MSSATQWLRRIRGAVGMGLTWAVGWALFGVLIGVASILLPGLPWNAFFAVFDAPLPALAVPGFLGGALFSLMLGVAARRRRFDELSVPGFAALGAVAGLVLGALPFLLGTASHAHAPWLLATVFLVPTTLLSAGSAAVTLAVARRAERRLLPGAASPAALRSDGA